MRRNRLCLQWSTLCLTACLILFAVAGKVQAEAVAVSVQALAEVAVYPELRAPATVLSLNESRISAELTARIVDIPVLVGQTVEQGAILAHLDDRDFQLTLARAEAGAQVLVARMELAEYELQRARSLAVKQVVPEQLVKQREAEVKILLAEQENQRLAIQQAKRNLEKTVLRTPFRAIITGRIAQLGEFAAPGSPLVQIVDAEQLEVSARVQAHLADSLTNALRLELLTNGKRHPLHLRIIAPLVEVRTQTREARLVFTDQPALPGNAGELYWQNQQAHIPAELLVRREGKLGVFIVKEQQASFFALTNAEEGRPAQTSLGADTLLVTEGRFQLRDGDMVTPQ